MAIILSAVLAGIALLGLGDPRQAWSDDIKLEMLNEASGFIGTLSAEVVKAPDKTNGWFQIRVIKVVSFARNNKTIVRTPAALTKVWKDKCVAVRGGKGMPELAVGDVVTITAAQFEMHLRSTRVSKQNKVKPAAKSPNKMEGAAAKSVFE